jgi:hypothetical protein
MGENDIPIHPVGSYSLRCLYGRHRVEAAKEVLFPGDSWGSVTLYHDSKPNLGIRAQNLV